MWECYKYVGGNDKMGFENRSREEMMQDFQDQTHDLLIIGGGLSGASLALDATTRGMKVGLLEMADYGSDTTLHQSMLLTEQESHDLKTWKQLRSEGRSISNNFSALYKIDNGLHLKYKSEYKHKNMPIIRRGLLYPFKIHDRDYPIQVVRKDKVLNLEKQVNPDQLEGGLLQENGIINRSRMTTALLKTTKNLGAKMLNYFKVTRFLYDENKLINGVEAEDQINGEHINIYARRVINTAGNQLVDVNKIDTFSQKLEWKTPINKKTELLITAKSLMIEHTLFFHHPKRRAFITIGKNEGQLVVTVTEQLTDSTTLEQMNQRPELNAWLEILNWIFPDQSFTNVDVLNTQVNYEQKYQDKINPENYLHISKSGLITALGTSWVASRLYASQIIDTISRSFVKEFNILYAKPKTNVISINKHNQLSIDELRKLGEKTVFCDDQLLMIAHYYGDLTDDFLKYFNKFKHIIQPYQIESLLAAELIYHLKTGSIYTPLDFFIRRVRFSYEKRDLLDQLGDVLNFLADQLNWSKEERSYFERESKIWLNNPEN